MNSLLPGLDRLFGNNRFLLLLPFLFIAGSCLLAQESHFVMRSADNEISTIQAHKLGNQLLCRQSFPGSKLTEEPRFNQPYGVLCLGLSNENGIHGKIIDITIVDTQDPNHTNVVEDWVLHSMGYSLEEINAHEKLLSEVFALAWYSKIYTYKNKYELKLTYQVGKKKYVRIFDIEDNSIYPRKQGKKGEYLGALETGGIVFPRTGLPVDFVKPQ